MDKPKVRDTQRRAIANMLGHFDHRYNLHEFKTIGYQVSGGVNLMNKCEICGKPKSIKGQPNIHEACSKKKQQMHKGE